MDVVVSSFLSHLDGFEAELKKSESYLYTDIAPFIRDVVQRQVL